MMKKITVFAGSSSGHDPSLASMVKRIGAMIAARGLGIIYGGGRTGLMGAVADGAIDAGGYVHGVIPQFLETLEVAHPRVTKLTTTATMHERKTIMYENGDAFIGLPGGFGTIEEMMEALTWRQLSVHNKPIYLFNYNDYWQPLMTMLNHACECGFVQPQHLNLIHSLDEFDDLIDVLDTIKMA